MRTLLLPFFIVRLLLAHSGFITLLFRDQLQKHKSLLLVLILSLFVLGVGLLNNSLSGLITLTSKSQQLGIPQQNYPLDRVGLENLFLQTSSQNAVTLAELAATNEKTLLLYPTHRDILINQLLLSTYLKETLKTHQVLEKLNEIDPNHPVVKKFSSN